MPQLISHTGHTFELPSIPLSFGAETTNDVVVPPDYGLAANHFALWPQDGGHLLRDSGSGQGCWVNGNPVLEAELRDGDEIAAGKLRMRYVHPERPPLPKLVSADQTSVLDPLPQQFATRQALAMQEEHLHFEVENETRQARLSPPPQNEPVYQTMQQPNSPVPSAKKTATAQRSSPPAWLPEATEASPSAAEVSANVQPQSNASGQQLRWKWIAGMVGLLTVGAGGWAAQQRGLLPFGKSAADSAPLAAVPETPPPAAPAKPEQAGLTQTPGVAVAPIEATQAPALTPAVAPAQTPVEPVPPVVAPAAPAMASDSYEAILTKVVFPTATTLYSLRYPDVEILYVSHAQKRGLAFAQESTPFLERFLEVKTPRPTRISSIHQNPETDGVILAALEEPLDVRKTLDTADRPAEKRTWGTTEVYVYPKKNGEMIGLANLAPNIVITGPEGLLKSALETASTATSSPQVPSPLMPSCLEGDLGSFLWTVKCDETIQQQLRSLAKSKAASAELSSVDSVAFRYKAGEAQPSLCFAQKRGDSKPEVFSKESSDCLDSMVALIENQALATDDAHFSVTAAKVLGNSAVKPFTAGIGFVNLFLENHFQSHATLTDTAVAMLKQARRIAHMLNLAKAHGVKEIAEAKTPLEAMNILDAGVTSKKVNNLDFQLTTSAEERTALTDLLSQENGLWACRMSPLAAQRKDAARILEGRDRMNADTVLNLISPPSADKIIRIPDVANYISVKLDKLVDEGLKANPNACARLFGMPLPNAEELAGMTKYIAQDRSGKLVLKPGEPSWDAWSEKPKVDIDREAGTIMALAQSAVQAGNPELAKVSSIAEAVSLLSQGVKGTGAFSSVEFRYKKPDTEVLSAALSKLKVKDNAIQKD